MLNLSAAPPRKWSIENAAVRHLDFTVPVPGEDPLIESGPVGGIHTHGPRAVTKHGGLHRTGCHFVGCQELEDEEDLGLAERHGESNDPQPPNHTDPSNRRERLLEHQQPEYAAGEEHGQAGHVWNRAGDRHEGKGHHRQGE